MERETYGDTVNIKYDLERLSRKIGFDITRFKIVEKPCGENGDVRQVIKVYTDSFPMIPASKSDEVRDWLWMEIHWTKDVCDAEVKVEGEEFGSILGKSLEGEGSLDETGD